MKSNQDYSLLNLYQLMREENSTQISLQLFFTSLLFMVNSNKLAIKDDKSQCIIKILE
jgi:hypothetical protein